MIICHLALKNQGKYVRLFLCQTKTFKRKRTVSLWFFDCLLVVSCTTVKKITRHIVFATLKMIASRELKLTTGANTVTQLLD